MFGDKAVKLTFGVTEVKEPIGIGVTQKNGIYRLSAAVSIGNRINKTSEVRAF